MMGFRYPDREIVWPDGSAIPAELRDLLIAGLEPGFEIEHGEFAWGADNELIVTLRLSVTQPGRGTEIWEIAFSYPADEAAAARADAEREQREWFTMMVRTHVAEWWNGGPSVVTAARQVKIT
jgi:hypothetical protein